MAMIEPEDAKPAGENFLARLSDRERQILMRAVRGHTDQAIANSLGISMGTIGTYWGRIRGKLGHFNRTELVAQYLKKEASQTMESLRERNTELQAEIEAERERTAVLESSLNLLQSVIESAADAIIVVNSAGQILIANEEAEHLFGYEKLALTKLEVKNLMPERFRSNHDQHRATYLASPTKKKMGEHLATLALRKDGTEFPITTLLSSTPTAQGVLVTCIIRDLTKD